MLALLFGVVTAVHAASFSGSVGLSSTSVQVYNKLELSLPLQASYNNPYDPSQIKVDAVFKHESDSKTVPCFFAKKNNKDQWLCRFAPPKTGAWSFQVSAKDSQGTAQSQAGNFTAVAGNRRGYIQKSRQDNLHFEYSDGTTYWPIGENMAWGNVSNYIESYRSWLPILKNVGGNYIRVWMNSGSWRLEDKVGDYNNGQGNADHIDELVDLAENLGFGILWCLNEHPDFSTNVNPNWNNSPYNKNRGGPLGSPQEVWTNSWAKSLFKYRYRYNIARWGYSTSVFSWELWNEMDWVDDWGSHSGEATSWVKEMYQYIKSTDPVGHLVTTSFAMMSGRDGIDQTLDWCQYHSYADGGYRLSIPDFAGWLADSIPSLANKWQKPTMVGEYGTSFQGPWVDPYIDPTGVSIHNEAYGSLVAGAGGSGFTWWWDNYVGKYNLWWRFQGISAFVRGEQIGGMKPIKNLEVTNSDKLRASSLSSSNKHIVWVQSKAHTWWNVKSKSGQSYVNDAKVSVSCQGSDKYSVQIWHTVKGYMKSNTTATCSGGKIQVSLPPFNDQEADWGVKLYSGDAPVPPTFAPPPTFSPTPDPSGGKGEWQTCSDSSECQNGCCSKEYSDGVYKCTPNGKICIGGGGSKKEWDECSSSNECANHCCSKEWSGGVYKCTPGSSQCL